MVKTEQDWVRGSLGDPSILTYSQALQPCWVHFFQTLHPGDFIATCNPAAEAQGSTSAPAEALLSRPLPASGPAAEALPQHGEA